jgi:hypothetical protein
MKETGSGTYSVVTSQRCCGTWGADVGLEVLGKRPLSNVAISFAGCSKASRCFVAWLFRHDVYERSMQPKPQEAILTETRAFITPKSIHTATSSPNKVISFR